MAETKAFKCTRPDGADFRTGTINYATALAEGRTVEVLDAEPPTGQVCGHGIHVSTTPQLTIRFAERSQRPWRWFEGVVPDGDIVEQDDVKLRVRRFQPVRELTLEDVFGPDFQQRIAAAHEEVATWKSIPWLKPAGVVTDSQIAEIIARWRDAIIPWLRRKDYRLPTSVKVVRNQEDAAAAADAAAAGAAAAAAAADAAADAAAAADDAADADAADAAAADAAAALPYWLRWQVRPRYVLWRMTRWRLAGMKEPNPWSPLVELYRLGCLPIGYVLDEFVAYCPEVTINA